MALIGISRFDTVEYVSDQDPCKKKTEVPIDPKDPKKGMREQIDIEPGATKFKLSALDVFTMGRIYDNAQKVSHDVEGGASVHTYLNQTNIEACQFGLKGWENFVDSEGQSIPFKTMKRNVHGRTYEIVADEAMKALGPQLAFELGSEIKRMSEVTAAEAKNSDGA